MNTTAVSLNWIRAASEDIFFTLGEEEMLEDCFSGPREVEITQSNQDETAYLLSSPTNARRLFEALNRNPQERIHFNNLDSLQDEVGIR